MDAEIGDFCVKCLGPGFLWARQQEIQKWPEPQMFYQRFADAIPRYVKTLGHLLSKMDHIVEGTISTTVKIL